METPLSSYMEREGISDAVFASKIKRDRSTVNKIRRGIVRPTLELAAVIEAESNGNVSMQSWLPHPKPDRSAVA